MTTNKRITDLSDYKSVLPYASEIFGVYQPLIGWKSRRALKRIRGSIDAGALVRFREIADRFKGVVAADFSDCSLRLVDYGIGIDRLRGLRPQGDSVLLSALADMLRQADKVPQGREWREIINPDLLVKLLKTRVFPVYKEQFDRRCKEYREINRGAEDRSLQAETHRALQAESATAAALLDLADNKLFDRLEGLFYNTAEGQVPLGDIFAASLQSEYADPYLSFDPKKDIKDVSLSPVGIVHLYRQYFFELDTFLGTPVSHVWLSPGASVELIETTTRRTLTEKTFETSLEVTTKSERSTTDQDEISEAVKQDNREDTKLGFSTTVNQSWGTGNLTATGSLNMDKTQQTAREQTQKRLRQQSEKLSTEIRQNYKSTFRTVTEVTDTSSKRYVLSNTTKDLINYELRRKMRQVGVQIQDIGSYLCWETFIDEPGRQLSLPNLVHIAQPADLILVPNPALMPVPQDTVEITFSGEMVWNFPENRQYAENHPEVGGRFVPLNVLDITGVPADYEVAMPVDMNNKPDPFIAISKTVTAANDGDSWDANNWGALGMITSDRKRVIVGITTSGGLEWSDRITFKVGGAITCRLSDAKKAAITTANDALTAAKTAANNENQRRQEEAYRKAAQERINMASSIKKRKFEALREEERTIVYRNLIASLMTESNYSALPVILPGGGTRFETQHVLSALINSIFDIDKMLYFVAPEWWKPRKRAELLIGNAMVTDSLNDSQVRWSDQQPRGDGYFITDKSEPAPLGSSLGWLLQLDGDDLRNAFLNAPWVRAVIPIRPGKEEAALAWLQNVGVEGSDGLDASYAAPEDELKRINVYLASGKVPRQFTDADWADAVAGAPAAPVTVRQALQFLCAEVAYKEDVSKTVARYPKEEIDDANKVLATPIDKVYEHGFYPLVGGFKAVVEDYFETISQWIEVLPTDQIVPVEVKYDPRTGRQVQPP